MIKENFSLLKIGAIISPILRRGERNYVFGMAITSERPRDWSPTDAPFLEEIAERVWSAIERARAEAALRESEERLQLATAAAGLFGWELDIATGRVKVSGSARAVIGFEVPRDEMGRLPHLHPDDADRVAKALERSQRTGEPLFLEHRLVRAETGEPVWVRVQGRVLTEGKLIGVTQNINAEKHAELARIQAEEKFRKELERSNQELAEFSFVLSHDLVGPSQSIHALGELLLKGREGKLNEGQQRLIRMITGAAAGMDRLVISMLEFAQVGHGMLQQNAIPLAELIDEVSERLAGAIRESDVAIHCGWLPTIEADRTQIEQLFQNLIENAIKYRKPGNSPVIYLSAESTEGEFSFAVQDNGQGVPQASLDWIFEPLKRLHGQDVPGSGLGLALCRKILERHGGRIWAASEGIGRGTTFRFVLPRTRPA